MDYPRLLRKLRWPAAALMLVCYASASWAQGGSWQEEMARIKAPLEERDPAAFQQMLREAAATDRAVAAFDLAKLVVYTYNFGNAISGRIFSSGRCHFPNPSGTSRGYIFESTPALAIGAGPWFPTALVHENSDFHSTTRLDWEPKDGSRGVLFSDPPQLRSGYPVYAISDQPATWPSSGWPAPSDEVPWDLTETWDKWELTGDRNAYCVFNDDYADAEEDGTSGPLGIEVRKRTIGYGAMNVIYMQYEFKNNTGYNLTGVYVGSIADKGSPSVNDWTGAYFMFDASRNLIWSRASNFLNDTHYRGGGDPGEGTGNEQLAFGGEMYLETPGGNYRESPYDPDNPGTNYISDPTNIINRLALLDWGDRVQSLSDEEGLYGAMTGDISYMESGDAQNIWKSSNQAGVIYMQDTDDYQAYNGSWETSTDHFYYVSYGEEPSGSTWLAGETFDMVVAYVGGYTESDMLAAADQAIHTYKIQFKGPSAPPAPKSFVANGITAGPAGRDFDPRIHRYPIYYAPSGNVTLSWDPSESYTTPDPSTNLRDFEGVRIYRSMDRGNSWGQPITDKQGNEVGWDPLFQWDLDNGISGEDGLSYSYLGDDTDMVTAVTDETALDGVEYWYAISSYDAGLWDGGSWGTGTQTLRSLESPTGSDPSVPTVIAVIAGSRPNGYSVGLVDDGSTSTLTSTGGEIHDGSVSVAVWDDTQLGDATYRITTTDSAQYGDLATQTDAIGVTLENVTLGTTLFTAMLPDDGTYGSGLLPITDGLSISVSSVWNTTSSSGRHSGTDLPTGLLGVSSGYYAGIYADDFYGGLDPTDMADAARIFTAEVRFDTTNTQYAYAYEYNSPRVFSSYREVPFTAWDVTSVPERQINVAYRAENGSVDDAFVLTTSSGGRHYVYILSSDYSGDATPDTIYTTGSMAEFGYGDTQQMDGVWASWWVAADDTISVQSLHGTEAVYHYTKPMPPGLTYEFSTTAPAIQDSLIDLDDIVVVPNPYYIYSEWDQSVNRRKIQFRNVPMDSEIYIYTLAGELVAILDHTGDATDVSGARGYNSNRIGTVDWNLWTYEYTEAAYGLYIYVVKSDAGTKVGKFAIIR